jgi:hypothetical protein
MRSEDLAGGYWIFVQAEEHAGQHWTWQRVGPTETVFFTSAPLGTFGKAITDAIMNGFRPSEHRWIIRSLRAEQTFPASEPPLSYRPCFPADAPTLFHDGLPKGEQEPKPGTGTAGED